MSTTPSDLEAALREAGAHVAEELAKAYRDFAIEYHEHELTDAGASMLMAARYASQLAERLRAGENPPVALSVVEG